MPRLLHQPPKYWRHKPSGQAVVKVAGRRIYLGKYGSPESHQRYAEQIARWRDSLGKPAGAEPPSDGPPAAAEVTVQTLRERRVGGHAITLNELILVFVDHARRYYRKNGKVTREAEMIEEVLGLLRKRYGRLAAERFGPVLLKELREAMISDLDWSRKHLNKQVSRLVRMFKWGVENELLAPDIHAALNAVPGLKKGRSDARETTGVCCVDDAVVAKTVKCLPEVIADMVRLQRLTGSRPGEVCAVRPGDIDRTGQVWVYTPLAHKTDHHELCRVVMIGPQAQKLLAPYLLRAEDAYCFTPSESEKKRYEALAAQRKSPLRSRDRVGAARRAAREYAPCYSADTYRHAVQRGCRRAGVEQWSPNQLRHTAATAIRKRYGLEAAQVVCGHESADVTQVYAERDLQLARKVASEVG
ncbi:tyrosine-type recombinase/integrase [Botrimarina mediterranea]|uniref:Site-specific tyrosine recombinase XerC n=1 Tax=Botrimarina mediterranea TaxID=2528022 RepID=A0A518K759_9BACT|nr:site-specific integrase [Botrimarina mediterranea]QDV73636.1 site-specific tyrosine recombinase XerC [Botrimarina mediterranea]QDV78226.1 site-specific tyrosine recombinase XerC [Planctomycetes bacterium K2D]